MRLEVTRKADLAVRALRALQPAGVRRKSSDLAADLGTTAGFLAQVMTPLVRAGWVGSVPGPTGGYVALAGDPSLLAVIEAADGPTETGQCVVAGRPCDSSDPCALHHAWLMARAALVATLATTPAINHATSATNHATSATNHATSATNLKEQS